MKKLFYIAICLVLVGPASSCSKQCVQCQATDHYGIVINKSNVICDDNLNRKHFENRYETEFQGYHPVCYNVSD